jgi:hypothetical protein
MPTFGGLDLRTDPQDQGLVSSPDLLNVSLDRVGIVRSRDGYAKFSTSAASQRYINIVGFDPSDYASPSVFGNKCLYGVRVSATQVFVDRIDTTGASTNVFSATPTTVDTCYALFSTGSGVVFGGRNQQMQTIVGPTPTVTAISSGSFRAQYLALQTPDNRLVAASGTTVAFSNPNDATTWGVNNFVTISYEPEYISGMASWQNMLFVFKRSAFYVFPGNSVDGSGNPVFNFRGVRNGIGCAAERGVTTSPEGVYFIHNSGIYVTTGGTPVCISDAVRGIFNGNVGALFQSSALNQSQISKACIRWLNNKLFVAYPSGSSTSNDRLLVLENGQWSLWDIPAADMAVWKQSNTNDLMFAYASGTNDIGQFSTVPGTYTTDAGTAITSRYRTGFWNPGQPGAESITREFILEGTGTVNVKTAVNDAATLGSSASVALGTAPAVGDGRDRRSVKGRNLSIELSSSSGAWSASRVIANVRGQRNAGLKAA